MKQCLHVLLCAVLAIAISLPVEAQQRKTIGKEVTSSTAQTVLTPARSLGTDIFVEGFNDTLVFPPANWLMINRDGNVDPTDTAWYSSTSVGGTGGPGPREGVAFAADYYGTANDFYIDDYLVTPNTGGTAPVGSVDSLTFWIASRLSSSGSYPDSLDIRVSTTGRNAVDFTTRLGYVLAPKALWKRFAYALPITTNRYIAFRYLMYNGGPSGDNSDKVCLDDVRITRYGSSAVGENSELPARFELAQNYPNPFNPTTNIRFQTREEGRTTLKVYSALGEEVAVVLDENLTPGTYKTIFDASMLSSGIYYYRLTTSSFTATKHMVLIK
jgi:hypothetical protein